MVQADIERSDSSEKVIDADDQLPEACSCISSDAICEIRNLLNAQNVPSAAFIDDHVANAIAQRNILADCLMRMRELIDAALAEAKVNFSNEPERDAVRLNQSLSKEKE